jgi:TolA-binding protein
VVRELRDIVFKGQKTGQPVVVQPAGTDDRLDDLARRISDLEQVLTRINGTMETTAHELDLAKKDNKALAEQVKALQDKLAAAEAAAAAQKAAADQAATEQAQAAAAEPPPKPTAGEAFSKAKQLMSDGDADAAVTAWEAFLSDYGDTPRAPEARYQLAKALSAKGSHARAAANYLAALRGWPKAAWGPDATVELARALIALKKPEDACQALAELPKHYPKPAASVANRAKAAAAEAKCA